MKSPRRELLQNYIHDIYTPVIKKYPSLYGSVTINLRQYGFVARFQPSYTMVVSRPTLETKTASRITYLTAITLGMFELYPFLFLISPNRFKEADLQKASAVLSFSRGFAPDYLRTCKQECDRLVCDYRYRFCGIWCSAFFREPCKLMDDDELQNQAAVLENKAKQVDCLDILDVENFIKNLL